MSRPVDDVILEIAQLARVKNLLGQNVNAFRGDNYDGSICSFAELLHRYAIDLIASGTPLLIRGPTI